jgi:hypothetical protein
LQLVLFLVHRFLSPWWRRRQVPPKRRFLQEPHGVTTQKTRFLILRRPLQVKSSDLHHLCSSFLLSTMKMKRNFGWLWTEHTILYISNKIEILVRTTDLMNSALAYEPAISNYLSFHVLLWCNYVMRFTTETIRCERCYQLDDCRYGSSLAVYSWLFSQWLWLL